VHLLPDRKPAAAGHAALYDTPRYQRFRRLLTRVIARKWRVAAGVVVLFMVALLGMSVVKKQFFPTSDRPEVLVEVQMPYGSSIIQTSAATAKIEHWLQQQPEAKIVTSYIGQGAPRFYLAMAPELPDPSFAKLVVLTDGQAPRGAQAAAAGGGGQWPGAGGAGARHSAGLWPLFALSGRLAGDGARSAHPARHRRSG
jgi:multidrug efflux pump subunit AcrB